MFNPAEDAEIRAMAFNWLSSKIAAYGDVLPRAILSEGFTFKGTRVPLIGPQGIFKPRVLQEVAISITSSPDGPYDDAFGADDLLRYRYRGSDPDHIENRGLRLAMVRRLPLIYFHGLVPGRYLVAWPVYIVADHPEALAFSVAVDDAAEMRGSILSWNQPDRVREDREELRRSYATAAVRVRLHQRAFRERVLEAYRRQCAFCRFRHPEMLDAAHIIPDTHPEGEPVVQNGLALCTLHHAAFDRSFLGLRPDYTIEVRPDILEESDGPTLAHAIQALHDTRIAVPRIVTLRPDPALVEIRYKRFRESFAGGGT